MDQMERTRRLTSGLGQELRNFFNGALADASDLPTKSGLKALIAEKFGDVQGVNPDKLAEAFVEFARRGQDRGARFELRGHVDELVLTLTTRLEEADRLIDVEEDEPVDAASLADEVDGADFIGGKAAKESFREFERVLAKRQGLG